MNFNPNHLKKSELLLYTTGHCKHRVSYLQHPCCFEHEVLHGNKSIKIGFFDLEFQNFKANYGLLLTYALKEYNKHNIYSGKIKVKDLRSKYLDKNLTQEIVTNMKKFDVLVTYYGTRCDIPYIRTRAFKWDIPFPEYGYIKHIDIYQIVRNKLSLNRNTLDNACALLGIKGKNHVIGDYWTRAVTGHVPSINYILDHNIRDVVILEKAYKRLIKHSAKTNRSI